MNQRPLKPLHALLLLGLTLAAVLLGPRIFGVAGLPPDLLLLVGYVLGLPVPALEAVRQAFGRRPLVVPAELQAQAPAPAPAPELPIDQRTTQPSLPAIQPDPREDCIQEVLEHHRALSAQRSVEGRAMARKLLYQSLDRLAALPRVALLLLLVLPSCSPALRAAAGRYGAAVAACGAAEVPAALQDGVSIALHEASDWRVELLGLAGRFGRCLVDAEVMRYTLAPGEPQTSSTRAALVAPAHSPGDLARERAEVWLREGR